MMKKNILSNLFVCLAVLLHNFLFWEEKMGINSFIFSGFIIASLCYLHPENRKKPIVQLVIFGAVLTSIMVVWHNSYFSKIIHLLASLILVGFMQQKELRFIAYALLLGIWSFLAVPVKFISNLRAAKQTTRKANQMLRFFKLGVLPFLILLVFFFIYYLANPQFAQLVDQLSKHLAHIQLVHFSTEWFLFFFSGVYIAGAIFWKNRSNYLLKRQNQQNEILLRQRSAKAKYFNKNFSLISLKNEYKMAIMLIASLNVLLFVVNFLDIKYVWFDFTATRPQDLSYSVHIGTYLLITAILLAIAVLLFFFRKNLNFYTKNKFLKNLSYVWVIQNIILCFSVAARNSQYIEVAGLAYKRIGVMLFLILVFAGLISLIFKIKTRRSTYYLLHRNAWVFYWVMIFASCVNWDTFITRYNIQTPTQRSIDLNFLFNDVSDKNIYLLYEYQEQLAQRSGFKDKKAIKKRISRKLALKRKAFEAKQVQYSWRSWNYSDYRNQKAIQDFNPPSTTLGSND